MDLTHEFTVPASIEETWEAFNDIESVGGCFPGAVVTSVEGDTFKGSCKVKLGPIALVYNGTGTFVEKDEAARTMRIEAKGKDKRGNGTAGANVTASMSEVEGGTTVTVVTDLAITGKPAQFGRGVMQDVSDKLLAQFVDCLAGKVGGGSEAEAGPGASADARAGDDVQADLGAPGDGTPDGGAMSSGAGAPGSGAGVAAASTGGSAAGPGAAGSSAAGRSAAAGSSSSSGSAGADDALDLGATVIPVLIKSYGKQFAAGLAGLLVLVWVVKRLF
ncbi:SRPBCC family protein [Nocardioides donggukensis]|uniref:SRPBCC family protein n=1 Tax=Nocardioides donggukensis TaxID=2774019 RepID=A0A927K420_9ACTN|nr:SRPBCC family protein [Nocardioides donggukensis]MBD8868418.1 SRPBCC family protein [Nocardioides donggukensis]